MPDDYGTIDEQVEALWVLFPKKVGKPAGLKAIKRRLREGVSFETMLAAVKEYAEAVEPLRDTPDWQFVMHPSTFWNQERYNDGVPAHITARVDKYETESARRNEEGLVGCAEGAGPITRADLNKLLASLWTYAPPEGQVALLYKRWQQYPARAVRAAVIRIRESDANALRPDLEAVGRELWAQANRIGG